MAWSQENPGELPSLIKLTELVQSLGLSPKNHIIVTSSGSDETDFGAAARVYWTLKVLGLENLSILNGGIKSWAEIKLPLNNQPVTIAKSNFEPKINKALITTKEQLLKKSADGSARLIDARPAAFLLAIHVTKQLRFQEHSRGPQMLSTQSGSMKKALHSLPKTLL